MFIHFWSVRINFVQTEPVIQGYVYTLAGKLLTEQNFDISNEDATLGSLGRLKFNVLFYVYTYVSVYLFVL